MGSLALALILLSSPIAAAEKQLRPFAAVTFKGSTTFTLGAAGASKRHSVVGMGAALVGDIVGIEGDVSWAPRFFQDEPRLVIHGPVTTATGNIVITLPKRLTEYTLRPYFIAGVGLMRMSIDDALSVFVLSKTLPAYDIGGGAVGFLTSQVGLAWDVRRFNTLKAATVEPGLSTEPPFGRLSFWRASMALVVRY